MKITAGGRSRGSRCGRLLAAILSFFCIAVAVVPARAADQRAAAPNYAVLFSFDATGQNPHSPNVGLYVDKATGIVYGTTTQGGAGNAGTLFSLTPPVSPSTTWSHQTLHDFAATENDGTSPQGSLATRAGAIYGTTVFGPNLVYRLNPPKPPATTWKEDLLHVYVCCTDVVTPYDGVTFDLDGIDGPARAMYGTTSRGTQTSCFAGCGAVYVMDPPVPPSKVWKLHVIHRFTGGTHGSSPVYGVTLDRTTGVLYGVASGGGAQNEGLAFSLAPPVSPSKLWTYQVIHQFALADGEGNPLSPLTLVDGDLYGMSSIGHVGGPGGAIYKLTQQPNNHWKKTVLSTFSGSDGSVPSGRLLPGPGGSFYGLTFAGGSANCGTIFKLSPPVPPSTKWTRALLHDFGGAPDDGCSPGSYGLTARTGGTLYGVTTSGGANNAGSVFSITP